MMSRKKILNRSAFTLVELLIAMTITLLLMAALAKSFGVIGNSIKEGRSQVSLSSKLRGISFRIRTDLRSRTADVTPPLSSSAGSGYFMYYEGPLTEHTMGMFGAEATRTLAGGTIIGESDPAFFNAAPEKSATYRRHGRVGDFDDYIAFTAEASGDQWFTGKVPAYLIDDSVDEDSSGVLEANNSNGINEIELAMEPQMIRSKFAEIIMWASPEWDIDPNTNLLQVATHANGGMPLYKDSNNDLVPDRIVLHQRTLLIRPDLNAIWPVNNGGGANAFATNVLRPVNNATGPGNVPAPLQSIYPIGAAGTVYPAYAAAGSDTDTRQMLTSNWLVGMAPMHHFFDLSLRRIIDPETGLPTGFVAANSMADLVQPHNRFAHVRYPGRYFGRGNGAFSSVLTNDRATSMPLLALGWNDTILNWQGVNDPRAVPGVATAPNWFPNGQPSPRTLNTASGTSRSGLFNGWLLPMFELGDPNPPGTSNGEHWERGYLAAADNRWDRTGEDVLTSNVLSFDIRAFDPTAPVFVTSGPDGQPGRAGQNDDGAGGNDQTVLGPGPAFVALTEMGAPGSDDTLIQASDLGAYDLMNRPILHPRVAATYRTGGATPTPIAGMRLALASQGAFVDLAYPMLAGSPLRERFAQTIVTGSGQVASPRNTTATAQAQVATNFNLFMHSSLSGIPLPIPTPTEGLVSLKRSGKLLHSNAAGDIVFFQPTYDTWTDAYESDGFDQTPNATGAVRGANLLGTTWVLNSPASGGAPPTPLLFVTAADPLQVDTGQWIPSDPETSPPFPTPLSAISVTVRLYEPASEEMSQFTVTESLE